MLSAQLRVGIACLRSRHDSPKRRRHGHQDPPALWTSSPLRNARSLPQQAPEDKYLPGHLNASIGKQTQLLRANSGPATDLDVVLHINTQRSRCMKSLGKVDVNGRGRHDCRVNSKFCCLGVHGVAPRLEDMHIDLGHAARKQEADLLAAKV